MKCIFVSTAFLFLMVAIIACPPLLIIVVPIVLGKMGDVAATKEHNRIHVARYDDSQLAMKMAKAVR